jgi:hypothetical protein
MNETPSEWLVFNRPVTESPITAVRAAIVADAKKGKL